MYNTNDAPFERKDLDLSLPGNADGSTYSFGRFVALPFARTLLLDGKPVALGARAFDLLMVLLVVRGEVVGKREIMQRVWPTTTVDECNLRFQMGMLRKALGDHRELVITIPGRGYLLAADIDADRFTPIERGTANGTIPSGLSANQRVVGEAICALLRAFRRYPDAIVSVEALFAREADDFVARANCQVGAC